jgi:hypothetical protein
LKFEADHVCFARGRDAVRTRGASNEVTTAEENMLGFGIRFCRRRNVQAGSRKQSRYL